LLLLRCSHTHNIICVLVRATLLLYFNHQGHYCDQAGLSAVAGPCAAQYYCHRGATTATPTVGISTATYTSGAFSSSGLSYGGAACTAGHYCPTGTVDPLQCLPGTYMSHSTASVCDACPVEMYCPLLGTVAPVACPQGSYCPVSTGAVTPRCPVGTYGAAGSLAVVEDCTPCTAGKYCGVTVSHFCSMHVVLPLLLAQCNSSVSLLQNYWRSLLLNLHYFCILCSLDTV
jgi:hypothetical protein